MTKTLTLQKIDIMASASNNQEVQYMSSDNFRFKQFTVWHDKCAMKVGTDGVLLGSWCHVDHALKVLDVGTGSGLIALMLAQRNNDCSVTAIDIDEMAVLQAVENFEISPFADRIRGIHSSLGQYVEGRRDEGDCGSFDLIVSNPPYYTDDVLSPDARRCTARHTSSLPFDLLIRDCTRLLSADGVLAVIVPYDTASHIIGIGAEHGLQLLRRCDVRNSERKGWKRSMLELGRKGACHRADTCYEQLTIHDASGEWSDSYRMLTAEFYIDK